MGIEGPAHGVADQSTETVTDEDGGSTREHQPYPWRGKASAPQAGDSNNLYARDTVPGCRVGDATSAGWLKTGAASAASVGVWTRSGRVVDKRAEGSLVANTAATVVRSGTD